MQLGARLNWNQTDEEVVPLSPTGPPAPYEWPGMESKGSLILPMNTVLYKPEASRVYLLYMESTVPVPSTIAHPRELFGHFLSILMHE